MVVNTGIGIMASGPLSCAMAPPPPPQFSWHAYFNSTLPPVTSVFVGALLAFAYTFYFNVRTSRNDVLKDFHSDLDKIEELVVSYWLGNHASEDPDVKRDLEIAGHQLRAKLGEMISYRDATEKLFNKKNQSEYNSLDTKLLIKATGGDFQTAKMQASPKTYSEIIELISEMRILIRKTRGRFFSSY